MSALNEEQFAELRGLLDRAAGAHGDSITSAALASLVDDVHLMTWRISNEHQPQDTEEIVNHLANMAYRADAWRKIDRLLRDVDSDAIGEKVGVASSTGFRKTAGGV